MLDIEATERMDGLVRFACPDLPGFRLLLRKQDDPSAYEDVVAEALRTFLPLYTLANGSADIEPSLRLLGTPFRS